MKTSASQTVTVSNTGTAALSISQASVSGTGYSMTGLSAPVTVAAGASTSFTVIVSTGDDGSGYRERLDYKQCESLTGDGKPDRYGGGGIDSSNQCDAERGELREPDGEDIASQTVTVSNTGTAALSISQASVSGTGYSMTGLTAPVTVAAGASTSFTVIVSAGDDGSLGRERNDYEQRWQFSFFEHFPQRDWCCRYPDSFRQSVQRVIRQRDSCHHDDTKCQVTNTGNAPVNITTVSATGTGFSVTGGSNTIWLLISPSPSRSVLIPTAAQCRATSRSRATQPHSIFRYPEQAAPLQHSVCLAWDPSPSTNIVS